MKIYHNPRCSKSRQALFLIQEKGENPKIIEYLKECISIEDLGLLLRMLKIKPIELIRKGEQIWKEKYNGKKLTVIKVPGAFEIPGAINCVLENSL